MQMTTDNQEFIIRRVVPEDAAALLDFIEQVAGESDNLTFGPGEFGLTLDLEVQFLTDAAQRTNALYLVAQSEGSIIGNLSFNAGRRPRIAHLGEFGITVAKSWWGRGVATRLIEELLSWSRQSGIRKINLRVRVDNETAIALYRKMGFVTEGLITRDLRVNGEFIDTLMMGLEIDPPSSSQ